MQFQPAGMPFYVNADTEVVVDPLARPTTVQNVLLGELRKCESLVQRDYRYAHLVAGSSKMPMPMIWSVRNQDELVNDADLAMFKDIAWNEFVKKRFLPTVSEASVCASAASMLEIVRGMNLQRRRFQIMGLHEQVEASEIQLVLHLCQAGITRSDDYRRTANRFRRSDRLYEGFALAVGANVCATAPLTLGAATARYERDLQYEYRKNAIALFVYVLQRHQGEDGLDEDYVARIARLIVVSPSDCPRVAGPAVGGGGGGSDDDDRYNGLSNALAVAQHLGEDARDESRALAARLTEHIAQNNTDLGLGRADLQAEMTRLTARYTTELAGIRAQAAQFGSELTEQVSGYQARLDAQNESMQAWRRELRGEILQVSADVTTRQNDHHATVLGLINTRPAGDGARPAPGSIATEVATQMNRVETTLAGRLTATADTAVRNAMAAPGGPQDQINGLRAQVAAHRPAAGAPADDTRLGAVEAGLRTADESLRAIVAGLGLAPGATGNDVGGTLGEIRGAVTALRAGLGAADNTAAQAALQRIVGFEAAVHRGLQTTDVTGLENAMSALLNYGLAMQNGLNVTDAQGVETALGTIVANQATATVQRAADTAAVDGRVAALEAEVPRLTGALRGYQAELQTLNDHLTGIQRDIAGSGRAAARGGRGGGGARYDPTARPPVDNDAAMLRRIQEGQMDGAINARIHSMSTAAMDAVIAARIQAMNPADLDAQIDARIAATAPGAPDPAAIDAAVDAAVAAIPADRFTPGINAATGNLDQRIDDAVGDSTRDLRRDIDTLRKNLTDAVALVRASVTAQPAAGPSTGLDQRVDDLERFVRQMLGPVDFDVFARGDAPSEMRHGDPPTDGAATARRT